LEFLWGISLRLQEAVALNFSVRYDVDFLTDCACQSAIVLKMKSYVQVVAAAHSVCVGGRSKLTEEVELLWSEFHDLDCAIIVLFFICRSQRFLADCQSEIDLELNVLS